MDKDREAMHRRAQVAEGALRRARYWFEAIVFYGEKIGDGYLSAIAGQALKAMTTPDGKMMTVPDKEPSDEVRTG